MGNLNDAIEINSNNNWNNKLFLMILGSEKIYP